MYAESKIELNPNRSKRMDAWKRGEESGLIAILGFPNPVIATTDQTALRLKVTIQKGDRKFCVRKVEDIWYYSMALSKKAIIQQFIGMLNCFYWRLTLRSLLRGDDDGKRVNPGLWFLGMTPEIDSDGLPNLMALWVADYVVHLNTLNSQDRQ